MTEQPRTVGPSFPQQTVALIRKIPQGRLVSYGQIARALGRPRAARIVGGILSALDSADRVTPWHRVVNRRGGLSPRSDPFSNRDPVFEQAERLSLEGLQPDLTGCYDLDRYGLEDVDLVRLARGVTMTEYLEWVDENNQSLGPLPRGEVRARNLLHRGVGILCWNPAGQLYVHQRTAQKDLFPSLYDMMVGGAVEAGEPYLAAARREVREELGVDNPDLHFLLEHLYDGPRNRSFVQLFEVVWDGPIVCQPEEIVWGQWMDFEQVLSWIETVEIVPDGGEVFQAYLRGRPEGRAMLKE